MILRPLRILLVPAIVLGAFVARPALANPAGFAFLEVPAGARAAAMGGAYASVAEGPEAAFWNPAGLAATQGLEITGCHVEYLQTLRHEQFAFAVPVPGGGISASIRAMYSEPIAARDELGNTIGTFGSHDLELALGYGLAFAGGTRWGATAQVVRERLDDEAATTMAFGTGVTWDPPLVGGLRLAASVHNLGKSPHYVFDEVQGGPVPLPSAVQAGGSYGRRFAGAWDARGTLETRMTRGRSGVVMVGGEIAHASGAALRAGYRFNDDSAGFSAGAGYSLGRVRLDYAFVPFRLDLGDTHRVAFTARL